MNTLPHPALLPAPARQRAPAKPRGRPFWVASAAWGAAALVCATVVMANVPIGDWTTGAAVPDAAVPAVARDTPGASPKARVRCQTCGIVESVRQFEASSASPARYEFTVRLRDGSALVRSMARASAWRIGDSIMLMGGEKPSAKAAVSL